MKKNILFLVILVLSYNSMSAQKAAMSVYAELGGAGLASANFDMRLLKKEDGLGFRVGIGGFSVTTSYSTGSSTIEDRIGITTIPLELNYLLGKNERNYFELGGGATIVVVSNKNSNRVDNGRFSSSFGHLYFGYRL